MGGDRIFGFERYPKFTIHSPRFSQDTFLGRWLHFNDVIDPRTLLVSKAKLAESIDLLDRYEKGLINPTEVSDRQLWDAQKIKQATVHPDTGEKIFMPFRMAGYVPFGTPIVVGLLLPQQTMVTTIFWQWLNQSHNAAVNYANRNASEHTPVSKFVQGYIGAVTTAVGIAVGLTLIVRKANRFSPATKYVVQKFIPFPAVAMASTSNVLLMRWHERSAGIKVYDENNQVVGTSQIAAKKALNDMAVTRAFLPTPIMVIPPLFMTFFERMKFLIKRPWLHLPINALLCTLSFGVALPIAIAIFPQKSKISTDRLEPHIRNATGDRELFYNKGL